MRPPPPLPPTTTPPLRRGGRPSPSLPPTPHLGGGASLPHKNQTPFRPPAPPPNTPQQHLAAGERGQRPAAANCHPAEKAVRGEDGKYHFARTSFDANALNADPALGLSYIVAPPRMQRYLDVSTQIYKTYLKYVSPADIYPYSIDEVFIDVTGYLPYYHMSAHELAMTMVREVLYNTGITATAGIGTNLYLAKLAMDIVAKHIPADKDGVRIAELDEQSYRYLLWNHRPLTDFWMTGPGTVKRLEAHGIYTMGDLARFSIHGEDRLYEIFGVDAEILIDHAWGYEPCGMDEIKSYKPSTNSISEGQVLTCPYPYDKAKLIVREMAEF